MALPPILIGALDHDQAFAEMISPNKLVKKLPANAISNPSKKEVMFGTTL